MDISIKFITTDTDKPTKHFLDGCSVVSRVCVVHIGAYTTDRIFFCVLLY